MRIDVELVKTSLVKSRTAAAQLIKNGAIKVNGIVITKPSFVVEITDRIEITDELKCEILPYASRGGLKIEKIFREENIDVIDRICLDIGASTGGFTDFLLKNGASKVYAVDVGFGQLDEVLKNNPKVVNMEKTDIRHLTLNALSRDLDGFSLITSDISFISLKLIISKIYELLAQNGEAVLLIKPQFEAGLYFGELRKFKNGVIKDFKMAKQITDDVVDFAENSGLRLIKLQQSPIQGKDGNIEFIGLFTKVD